MVFQFNRFTLDTDQYRLCIEDAPISVEPQVFDLLVYLIENRHRVVSRDELLDSLWKGKVVTDSALSARLKDVRKAVGDSGDKQQVIKTFHGRGYQFIADVNENTIENLVIKQDALNPREDLPLPIQPSIAVLPFQNISGDSEQQYFADGMSEDIITALSRIPDLVVIARNSTFVYSDRVVDVRQVGRELGVGHVLEGSIRKSGNRLRITAQLVDTQSGNHLWAEHYDRKLDDIFAVQDEITHAVVVELQVKLVTGEHTRRMATGTKSIEAWELVIRAGSLTDSQARDDAMVAKQLLGRALEIDKNYSAAWTMLGWVYWGESVWKWCPQPEKSMQLAYDAAQKAIAADKHYPNAYSLLGEIYMVRGDAKQAIKMCEKAVEFAPSDSLVLACLGNVLIDSGKLKAGIQKAQRALRLCPFPPTWYLSVLGAGLHLNGDNEAAISILERAAEREPNSTLSRLWLAVALVETGRLDDAHAVTEAILDIEPGFSAMDWASSFKSNSHARIKDNLLAAGFTE